MSEQSPRDTQFIGFAKLLYEELAQNVVKSEHRGLSVEERAAFRHEQERIVARRAYDLVHSALSQYMRGWNRSDLDRLTEIMLEIPDMTAWPEETKHLSLTKEKQNGSTDI